MSPHCGGRALLRGGVSRSGGGAQADLERLLLSEGGAGAGATGRCPRRSGQGGRRAELSKNEGVRVETEQEEPGGTSVRGGGGQTWFDVLRNHSCAL